VKLTVNTWNFLWQGSLETNRYDTWHNIISLLSLYLNSICATNNMHRNSTYDTDHINHVAWQIMQWYKFASQTGDCQRQCGIQNFKDCILKMYAVQIRGYISSVIFFSLSRIHFLNLLTSNAFSTWCTIRTACKFLINSFYREHTNVLQNTASVMRCIREHETNCQWLMELLGQIQNAINKKTDADNQQVRITTVIPPQKIPSACFKFWGTESHS
jgi:hypothetical protein